MQLPYMDATTVQLFLYEFTAVCPGCLNLHDVNTTCNLNPSFIGTALAWHSQYSKKMIPLLTLAWDHRSPLRYEPGNRTPSSRFARWPNQDTGYFLGRLGTFLATRTNENQFQHNWYINFKIQACDKTREWHLSVPTHKVGMVLEEVLIVMRASKDTHASLRVSRTQVDVSDPSDQVPPLSLYV
jgi:hypothetical protein